MNSVCLALYNGEKYIAEQVASILSQLGEDDELIVSDDGSTDRSIEIINSFHDPRVRVVKNAGLHGVNANFENALRYASGDIIFLADQDNVWLPGKAEECIRALEDSDLVVHDAFIADLDLNHQNKSLFEELIIKEGFLNNFIRNRFSGCCMAFRREILAYALPFPRKGGFFCDNWIGLIASLKGKTRFIPFKGLMLRRHEDALSSVGASSRLPLTRKISYRLSLLSALLKRLLLTLL